MAEPVDELRAAIAATKAALIRAERAAADVVEGIDATFPRWHETGPPANIREPLRSALAQLDRMAEMRRDIRDEAVALESRLRGFGS
jgi:hypothetical protein